MDNKKSISLKELRKKFSKAAMEGLAKKRKFASDNYDKMVNSNITKQSKK